MNVAAMPSEQPIYHRPRPSGSLSTGSLAAEALMRRPTRVAVIAVANHKGGVGKSFTAVNLAAGLAQAGWRTLLVDCDAQGNSTTFFDPDEDVDLDLYDLIKNQRPVSEVIRKTRIASLNLVPSTLAVAQLDQELVMTHRREYQLTMALEPIYPEYEAIVLDLSPNLGPLVVTALNAADAIVIPTDPTKWGRRGVQMFMQWSSTLRDQQVLSAELLGVLLTKYEPHTAISREMHIALRDDDLPLFHSKIPKRTAAERMVAGRHVVGDPEADPDLTRAYVGFTVEVMTRLDQSRRTRGRHHA